MTGPAQPSDSPDRPRLLAADERLLLHFRPSPLLILLHRQAWWLIPPALALLTQLVFNRLAASGRVPWLTDAAVAWLAFGLAWRIVLWLARAYMLTDRRLIVRTGVLRIAGAEVPLHRIQHTTLTRSFIEQLFNLGTIGVTTAGADGPVVNLLMVNDPDAVIRRIRDATEHAAGRRAFSSPPLSHHPPIIGLAGGIGSGKSEVARILADLGCIVVDSDKEAKEALDRPEVRDRLVAWWGPSVLDASGKVNRRAVADIVFASPKDRAALESLVHPLVRARRADLRDRARAANAPAAVIDAPLLFEAGVDAECDAVLFIDSPREVRLARLKGRGWDEAELARRESAQLPLEEKQRRSTMTIVNAGTPSALRESTARALASLTGKG